MAGAVAFVTYEEKHIRSRENVLTTHELELGMHEITS